MSSLVAKKDAVTYYLSNISNTITLDSLDHQELLIANIPFFLIQALLRFSFRHSKLGIPLAFHSYRT
jgi:hypothetical protein